MNTPFERVGLIGKSGDRNVSATLQTLTALLERHRLQILLDEGIADMLAGAAYPVVSRDAMARQCDLAIVVGGDGTLLNAARSLAEPGCAVLGVNLGRLGFLVDVSPEEMDTQLDRILDVNSSRQRTLCMQVMKKEPLDQHRWSIHHTQERHRAD
jgi:NAD+ kinase